MFIRTLATALLLSTSSLTWATAALPPMPPPQYYGSVVYVTGGIGSDEAAAFRHVRANYALSLNFSQRQSDAQRGAFLADVQVVIRDSNDFNVLNITSEGPFCFIQLPKGQYQVHLTFNGETKSYEVTIGDKPTALDVQWTIAPPLQPQLKIEPSLSSPSVPLVDFP